jgi:hypothetical protein
MRTRVRRLALCASLVAVGWVAAPALSAQPYVPVAVDFEQRLPELARVRYADHGRGTDAAFRSPVLTAPERFDLVGLAGELRPLELRAREAGGEWSAWIETGNGDPVYFGGAEEVQLRAHDFRPEGRLHYVNVSGTTSGASSVLTGARRAINSAFISVAGLLEPSASAAPERPEIVPRSAWGANDEGGCTPRTAPLKGRVKAAAIHHTVTAGGYSEAEAPGIVLGICRYHRNANDWNDIGYNALVDRFGNIYAGRAGGLQKQIVGAHAQGFNAQTVGVAAIGTHSRAPITARAMEGFVSFLAWKLPIHGARASGRTTLTSAGGSASRYPAGRRVRINRVFGHGRVGVTACPGTELERQLGQLRRRTQTRIDAGGGSTEPIPPPPDGDGGGLVPR